MKKAFKILLILVALGIIFYAFQIIRNRYGIWPSDSQSENQKATTQSFETDKVPTNGEEKSEKSETPEGDSSRKSKTVTSADCDNECRGFEEGEELDYCEQICGISDLYEKSYESEEDGPVDCEKRTGLERDYCFKDLAIEESDFKICDQVKDSGIQKTCRDRITEDLLESQEEE